MANDKKKRKKEKEKLEKELQEKMNQMMDELENQLGVDKSQIKIIRIDLPKRNFKHILWESLTTLFLNMLLILSLSGYLTWAKYDSIWDLVLFTLVVSVIEIVLINVIHIFMKKLIQMSFGLILTVPILIAIVVALLICKFIEPTSALKVIALIIALPFIRRQIKNIIFGLIQKKKIK